MRVPALLAALALCGLQAHAQPAPVASVEATLSGTDNGNLAPAGSERSDTFLALRPGVQWRRAAPGLDVSLQAGAILRHSFEGTQPDRASPWLQLASKATLVERLVSLEADAGVREVEADPYAARVEPGTGGNASRAGYVTLAPQLEASVAGVGVLARQQWSLARREGASQGDIETERTQLRGQTKPRPLGVALEWTHERTRFPHHAEGGFSGDALRGELTARLSPELEGALIGGREKTTVTLAEHSDSVHGLRWHWVPGPRTELSGRIEERFFGRAWDLKLQHRMPWLATELRVVREVLSNPLSLGVATPASGLGNFLDAMLTTRVADPLQRASLVNSLLAQRGLSPTDPYAIDVQADYAQLRNAVNVGFALMGPRDTLSVTAYREQLTLVQRPGDEAAVIGGGPADNRQWGALVEAHHRLTPVLSLDALLRWSRISGLGAREGDRSDEAVAQLALARQMSPRTTASAGVQRRRYRTTVTGLNDFTAASGYVGVKHRF